MSPACILKAKQPRLPRARLGTVSGCHWTCIWIIQSHSAIFFSFFFFFKKKERNQKPDVQESLGITGYKIRTSVPQSPPLSESVPLPTPPPPHPTSLLLWFSTLPTQYRALSLLNAWNTGLLSALTGLIRWLENMWLLAFQAQAPFLGMELTCSAAGSCMGKLFENWYPAYCSSHCYNYFFVSLGKHIVWHKKNERAEFSFIKKKSYYAWVV